jgi:hypothetical protein
MGFCNDRRMALDDKHLISHDTVTAATLSLIIVCERRFAKVIKENFALKPFIYLFIALIDGRL